MPLDMRIGVYLASEYIWAIHVIISLQCNELRKTTHNRREYTVNVIRISFLCRYFLNIVKNSSSRLFSTNLLIYHRKCLHWYHLAMFFVHTKLY